MNKPVNFETAKLLKEKGYPFEFITVGKIKEVSLSMPAIAEVVMWLYDKYRVWTNVSLNQFSKPKDLQWMYSIVFIEDCTYSHSSKSYNSPTEAYEAGFMYILEKL